jgi:actin
LSHTFCNELRHAPDEALGVVLTESAMNSRQNREKMACLMFDTYQVKNFSVVNSGLMALYAHGRNTGLVCDSGDNVTTVTAVCDNCVVPQALERIKLGGRDLTIEMQKLLA